MPPTISIEENDRVLNDQRYAIMAIDVASAVMSPFRHAEDVPANLTVGWARAEWQAAEWYLEAQTEIERDCALRWQYLLHDILLRQTARGGRRGRSRMAARFEAFEAGEYTKLVTWYIRDRAWAVRRNGNVTTTDTATVTKAIKLIGEGELSRAVRLLGSKGLADVQDPEVIAQLAAKHPERKRSMPGTLEDKPRAEVSVCLRGVYGRLPRRAGTGPDGKRNEHLSVLDRDFSDPQAAGALAHHEAMATLFVNGKLPSWYYWVQAASRIVASIKVDPGDGSTPDVRPIAMGNVGPRAWAKAVANGARDLFGSKLAPVQVAIGMSGGISTMAFGARALLELRPDFVAVKLDKKNAYNEIMRAHILEILEEDEELSLYAPFFHAAYSAVGPVFLGGSLAPFGSAEGGRQGDPFFCGLYCLATHLANSRLAEEMRAVGGAAFFDVDDGIIIGPPDVVYAAARRYGQAIAHTGEELRISKCASYSKALGADLASHGDYDAAFPVSLDANGEPGLNVCGVPVGTDAYVAHALTTKVDDTLGNITKISNKLRAAHLQSLFTCVSYSFQHMIEFWAQHCYPTDSAAPLAAFDAGLTDVVAMAHGGSFVVDDPLLERRMRLPVRLRGTGIRQMAQVAPAAFMGMACLALPQLVDATSEPGVTRAGAAPALVDLLGAGSFDAGNSSTRFAALASSGSRLATEMVAAWGSMQLERPPGMPADADADLLDRPFASAGVTEGGVVTSKLQRALTRTREDWMEKGVDDMLCALPVLDARRTAWLSVDDFSAAPFVAWPAPGMRIRNGEWTEVVAMYFGAPSPACAPYVGQPILVNGVSIAPLDQYGSLLISHARLSNLSGGRVRWHDDVKHRLSLRLREGEVPHACEVFGLFAAVMPPAGRARAFGAHSTRAQRQGIVPDFVCQFSPSDLRLLDVKTVGLCSSWYNPSRLRGNVRGRCIRFRAAKVSEHYVRKADQLDMQYCGTAPGAVGPVRRKLDSYGPVIGLAFGAFGEVSEGVRQIVDLAAHGIAKRHFFEMGARSLEAAEAAMRVRIRRELGVANVREHARLKLSRLDSYVRGSLHGYGGSASPPDGSDGQHAARRAAYEASCGFTGYAGWAPTADERREFGRN